MILVKVLYQGHNVLKEKNMWTFKVDTQNLLSPGTTALMLEIQRIKRQIYYPKLSLKSLSIDGSCSL